MNTQYDGFHVIQYHNIIILYVLYYYIFLMIVENFVITMAVRFDG